LREIWLSGEPFTLGHPHRDSHLESDLEGAPEFKLRGYST